MYLILALADYEPPEVAADTNEEEYQAGADKVLNNGHRDNLTRVKLIWLTV